MNDLYCLGQYSMIWEKGIQQTTSGKCCHQRAYEKSPANTGDFQIKGPPIIC